MQISESHCGPAVVQMLLQNAGFEATQEQIAEAAGVTNLIEMNGTRVDQLAMAVSTLAPGLAFWYKEHASMQDLITLVEEYDYPAGVEWQGIFEDEDTLDEEGDDDYGHYSIISHIDVQNRLLVIVDPYKDYFERDRVLRFKQFLPRWWDYNEVTDPLTGRSKNVQDYHMLFIIAPSEADFPPELGLRRFVA
jgi:hypothetical protein